MRPKPFKTEVLCCDERYVRDSTTGLVWYRCKNRTLYADTDRSTVVYHSNYLRYFEYGRASLMRDTAYPYREIEESGFIYPIIEIGAKFYQPLFYDDTMWIHIRPADIERVRLRFDYVIVNAETDDLICKGFSRHCAINPSGTPVEIDPKTQYLWENFPK